METFELNLSSIVFGSKKNMCIEKQELGWLPTLKEFPEKIRLKIKDGDITEYASYNLTKIEGYCAFYNGTIFNGEELLFVPKLPKELIPCKGIR